MREQVRRTTPHGSMTWYQGMRDSTVVVEDTEAALSIDLAFGEAPVVRLGRGDSERTMVLGDLVELALTRQRAQRVYTVALPEWMVTTLLGASVTGAVFSFLVLAWLGVR